MHIDNPLAENVPIEHEDQSLVARARCGDRKALEDLVGRHQAWIYNIALRMLFHPQDAEDATQEILIKVVTRLASYEGRSSFRTWLYRIVVNHVLNMKRGRVEDPALSFRKYGDELSTIPDLDLPDPQGRMPDARLLVTEAMLACTSGMLLCLEREQRLAYILGAILDVSDTVAAEILEITSENFRQRLARARRDLRNFMNDKCGLLNQRNPCRCAKKTRGSSRQATSIRRICSSSASESVRCVRQRPKRSRPSKRWTTDARISTASSRSISPLTLRRWCGSWSRPRI
jgi:RNA polymerase sigma factor (sigma-70 family)